MEIERKWLLRDFPKGLELIKQVNVQQGYLSTNGIEARVRDYIENGHEDYLLTFKDMGTICREEVEDYISKEFYTGLKAMIGKPFISKDFRKYKLPDGKVLQVSRVDAGTENEFYYAEIEFDTLEEAEAYVLELNTWVLEVTHDKCYKMSEYWKRTRLGGQ